MKTRLTSLGLLFLAANYAAAFPVFDAANLKNNRLAHTQTLVRWTESLARLKTQINQINQQIEIQTDVRNWVGDPAEAGREVLLDVLGAGDLTREYGRARRVILATADSLASLGHTVEGTYRAIDDTDLDGGEAPFDPQTHRRYTVLAEQQQNYQEVVEETTAREIELQEELALTLGEMKSASTDAEVQKQAAKIGAINGQLAALAAQRRDQADQMEAQKMANDARMEQERIAAAELEIRDNHLANQRVSAYMRGIKFRQRVP